MQIITGKIGSGKTIEMIRQAIRQNLTIVCRLEEQKHTYINLAKEKLNSKLQVITYDTFLNKGKMIGRNRDERFIIDDIETFFKCNFNRNIVGFLYDGTDITFTEKINGEFYKKDLTF